MLEETINQLEDVKNDLNFLSQNLNGELQLFVIDDLRKLENILIDLERITHNEK